MITEFVFYFLSFLPLWISIIFIEIMSIVRNDTYLWTEYLSIIIIILGMIICIIVTEIVLNKKETINREEYILVSASDEKFITAEFLMTYVLPLFAFDFTKWDGVVLFLFFFLIFGVLVHRHKYFCTNIYLELRGYRVYVCEIETEEHILNKRVVSRNDLCGMAGSIITTRKYNNEYHIEV